MHDGLKISIFDKDRSWTPEEILALIKSDDVSLFSAADKIRKKYCGDEIHIRGIIEFSNYCRMNCDYCGIRRDNKVIERYRLEPDFIVACALDVNKRFGINTIVLQSGEDLYYSPQIISDIVKKIKSESDIAITLSIGERDFDEYMMMHKAGADRFLLKQETFSEKLYSHIHPGASFSNRMESIMNLQKLGYQTGSGIIVGLPNQTVDDIAFDISVMQKLALDMTAIGPLIPHPETPLHNMSVGDPKLTLKAIAASRIVIRETHIPATTALGALDKNFQKQALNCGANVIMINFTPTDVKKLYEIYPNKDRCISSDIREKVASVKEMIVSINRKVGLGKGGSLRQ